MLPSVYQVPPPLSASKLQLSSHCMCRPGTWTQLRMPNDGPMLNDSACAPTRGCTSALHDWARREGAGFWVGNGLALKRFTIELPKLHRCLPPATSSTPLVDVGAGIHGLNRFALTAQRLHADDSDSLWMLSSWKGRAEVHAFEANPYKAKELVMAARARPMTTNYSANYTVHAMGVGAKSTAGHVSMCSAANTWAVRAQGEGARCRDGASINITSLDDFFRLRPPPLYVKIDVEGGEWDVLTGMRGLLERQQVELLSVEYAQGWDVPMFKSARHKKLDAATQDNMTHTLAQFQRKMFGLGYDTYLFHTSTLRNLSNAISLFPVYGDFWRRELEICAHPKDFYPGRWCWNDLLVIKRTSKCIKQVIFDDILPATVQHRRQKAGGSNASPYPPEVLRACSCV